MYVTYFVKTFFLPAPHVTSFFKHLYTPSHHLKVRLSLQILMGRWTSSQ